MKDELIEYLAPMVSRHEHTGLAARTRSAQDVDKPQVTMGSV